MTTRTTFRALVAGTFAMVMYSAVIRSSAPEAFGESITVQLTHGNYMDPSMSPDGRRMVVIALRAGREQLEIVDADGRNANPLPLTPFDREDPSWSPDGIRIAYVSKAGDGEAIHVMFIDGTNDVAVTPDGQRAIHPTWSPDGRELFYCTDDDLAPPRKNDSDIVAVDLQTGTHRQVITGGTNTYPAVSPDGAFLAYRKIVGGNSEVWLAGIDGSHPANLTKSPSFDGWPAWAPDGRRIAFGSNRGGPYQIYTMWRDGSHVHRVAETTGRATAPQWSKDGSRIVFPICRREDGRPHCEVYSALVPTD